MVNRRVNAPTVSPLEDKTLQKIVKIVFNTINLLLRMWNFA